MKMLYTNPKWWNPQLHQYPIMYTREKFTREFSGMPDLGSANDFVNWCTAAFAIPYPIIPGVPADAGAAPGNTRIPPLLRYLFATLAEIVELHTLCFHIRSEFLIKSFDAVDPPAQPPNRFKEVSVVKGFILIVWKAWLTCS